MIKLINFIFIALIFCSDESRPFLLHKTNDLLQSDVIAKDIFLSIQNLCIKVIEKKENNFEILLEKGFLVFISNIDVFIQKQPKFQFIINSYYKESPYFLLLTQIEDISEEKSLVEFLIKSFYDCNYIIYNRQQKKNGKKIKKFESIEYEEIEKNKNYLFLFEPKEHTEDLFTFVKKVQSSSSFFKKKKGNFFCFLFDNFLSCYERSLIEISIKNFKIRKLDQSTVIYISINKQDFITENIYPVFRREPRETREIYAYFFSLSKILPAEKIDMNIPSNASVVFKKINIRKTYYSKRYKPESCFFAYSYLTLDDFNCKKLVCSLIKRVILGFRIEINIEFKLVLISVLGKKKYKKNIFIKLICDNFEENFTELKLYFDSNNLLMKFEYKRGCYSNTYETKKYESLEDISTIFNDVLAQI